MSQPPKSLSDYLTNTRGFECGRNDTVECYDTNSVYNCSCNNIYDYKYLLGILNSKVVTFWFNTAYLNIDNIFPHIQKNQLESIPIVDSDFRDKIESLSSSILAGKVDIVNMMTQIDLLVYSLYNLTYDEICIIDPKTDIMREVYEIT